MLSLSLELEKNFGVSKNIGPSASAKFTVTNTSVWTRSSSETFSTVTTSERNIEVPGGKGIEVYQLKGKYGPLSIGTHHFRYEPLSDN
ncbi:MAG: hypothetical protein AAF572_23865 [Cyanobacteria bacterium P01_B01_bin.77]